MAWSLSALWSYLAYCRVKGGLLLAACAKPHAIRYCLKPSTIRVRTMVATITQKKRSVIVQLATNLTGVSICKKFGADEHQNRFAILCSKKELDLLDL